MNTKNIMRYVNKILPRVLFIFALISIGFMLGKNSHSAITANNTFIGNGDYLAVYYMHSTYRCETCNSIESMTRDLLQRDYAEQLQDKSIQWKEVDFMKNRELAEVFEVAASCVVVARIRDGRIEDHQRLDEVWTLIGDPPAFNTYIRTAIDRYLNSGVAS